MVLNTPDSGDGVPSSSSTRPSKRPKRTTSYADDRRTPSMPTPTTTPVTTSPSSGSSSTSGSSAPIKQRRTRADQPNLIDQIVNSAHTAIEQSQNQPKQNSFEDFFKARNASQIGGSGTSLRIPPVGDRPDPKPKPTYLQSHPLIAQQVQIALQGDPEQAGAILGGLLDEKFFNDNERLSARLKRRSQKVSDYYSQAKIAAEAGDLDYTTDTPINPKWLKSPDLHGLNNPADQRKLWLEMRAADPEHAPDLDAFFAGMKRSKYDSLGGFGGTIEHASYRKNTIDNFRADLETTKSYYDRALNEATVDEKRYDNWSADDEAKQDAERQAEALAKDPNHMTRYTIELDSEGNPTNPSFTDPKDIDKEIRKRLKNGLLDPENFLSLLGNSDVLTGPDINLTPEQQEAYDKARQAAAEEARTKDVAVGAGMQAGPAQLIHEVNSQLSSGISSVMDGSGDVLLAAIDKLSRPLFGMNAMRQHWSEMDKDPEHKGKRNIISRLVDKTPNALAYELMSGKAFSDSVDDVSLSTPGDLVGAGWKGFSDGGFGNADHPHWGSEIIAYNADRDGVQNIYDNHWFQTIAGLTGDIVGDPLTYVGVGPVKTVVGKGRNIAEFNRDMHALDSTSKEVTALLKGTSQEIDHEAVRSLLNGNWTRRPVTNRERIEHVQAVNQGVSHLQGRIDRAVGEGSLTSDKKKILEYYGQTYRERLAQVIGDHEDDAFRSIVGDEVVDDAMSVRELAPNMPGLHARLNFNDEVARRMGFGKKYGDQPIKYGSARMMMNHRGTLTGKELEEFDAQIAKHEADLTEAGTSRGIGVEDVFGPRFTDDTPFTKGQVYNALRNARRVNRSKPEIIAHRGQLKGIRNSIANEQRKLAKAKPSAVAGYKNTIAQLEQAADRTQRILNHFDAEQVVNLLSVGETKAYRSLQYLKGQVEKKLLDSPDREAFVGTRKESTPVADLDESGAIRDVESRMESLLDSKHEWDPKIINEPMPGYRDMRDQLEHVNELVQRELKDLETKGVTTNSEIANLLDKAPEGFIKDGKFNWDDFMYSRKGSQQRGYVEFNPRNNLFVKTRDVPDAHINNWVDHATEALNQQFHKLWEPIRNKTTRSLDEYDTRLAESAWASHVKETGIESEDFTKLQTMFNGATDGPAVIAHPATGELIEFERIGNKAAVGELVTKSDIERFNEFDEWLMTSKAGDEAPQKLINEIRSTGRSIPSNRRKAGQWLKKNMSDTKLVLSKEQIAARRIFKKQHGMSLGEARIMREHAFGDVVGTHMHANTPWRKAHPNGVAKREFLIKALKDKKSFEAMFVGGPFKLDTLTKQSAVEARKAAKAAALKGERVEGEAAWVDKNWRLLQEKSVEEQRAILTKTFDRSIEANSRALNADRAQFISDFKKQLHERNVTTWEDKKARANLVADATKAEFDKAVAKGHVGYHPFSKKLSFGRNADESFDAVKSAKAHEVKAKRTALQEAIRASDNPAEVSRLKQALQDTRDEWKKEVAALEHARIEARKSAEVMKTRMSEEAILRAASADLGTIQKQMQLGVLGTNIPLPGSQHMFAAVEKMSGLPLIKGTRKNWADAFQAPSKKLNDVDLHQIRQMQVNHVPNLIEHHAKELTAVFGKYKQGEREHIMNLLFKDPQAAWAANPELTHAIYKALDPIVERLGAKVGNVTFNIDDLNRRLPQGLNLSSAKPIKTTDDLLEAIVVDPTKVAAHTKRVRARKLDKVATSVKDPWALAWEMRIASETAVGDLMMYHMFNTTFGVKRGYHVKHLKGGKTQLVKNDAKQSEAYDTIEKLQSQHGWDTLEAMPEQHRTHLFPKEAIADMNKLMEMLAPANRGRTGELIQTILRIPDAATSSWKAGVTMYNPGYYTRNGVGEIVSSIMAGVHSPKPYLKASKVMRYVHRADEPLQSLLAINPMAKHLELGDKTVKGSDVALTMKNGRKITYDDLWVGFSQELKTGFFNTEFTKQGRKPVLGENPVGRGTRRAHNKVRSTGEGYENWLRLSHFIDVIEKSGAKTFEEAVQEGAAAVRKYHFDYTDFTPFEKAVMMRAFPFYKWTRKAMPMMATLLFTHPGKMTAFPKTMNYVSNQLTNTDISEDPNGVAPNFTGIAPLWVQQLWGYQISEENDGQATSFRLATPQMDALSSLTNPTNTAYTLMNPLLKAGTEQALGQSIGDNIPGTNSYDIKLDNPQERLKELLRQAPQGSFAAKGVGEQTVSKNDWLSFISGLGFYDTPLQGDNTDDALPNGLTASDEPGNVAPVGVKDLLRILAEGSRP